MNTIGGAIVGIVAIDGKIPAVGQISGYIPIEIEERVGNAIVGKAIVREE
jgi:hypothetical protein